MSQDHNVYRLKIGLKDGNPSSHQYTRLKVIKRLSNEVATIHARSKSTFDGKVIHSDHLKVLEQIAKLWRQLDLLEKRIINQ